MLWKPTYTIYENLLTLSFDPVQAVINKIDLFNANVLKLLGDDFFEIKNSLIIKKASIINGALYVMLNFFA